MSMEPTSRAPANSPRALTAMGLPFSVAPGAEGGSIKLVPGRVEDNPRHGPPIDDHGQGDGEIGLPLDIGPGAVDGIDDEKPAGAEPFRRIGGFFRQPAVVRPGGAEHRLQLGVDGKIGLGHRALARLFPDLVTLCLEIQRQLPGGPRRRDQKIEIGGQDRHQAPAMVRPSMRRVGALAPKRNSRSLAGVRFWNISFRLPAMVISLTG